MQNRSIRAVVLLAALGYFVDIYDLILFSIIRITSLKDLSVPESAMLPTGVLLINMQMGGMLLGGILWGVLGDKRGRLSVLYGSILLYSLANIANGFVQTVPQYALLRLIAGIGLAGELGAGVTLVSEMMDKEKRGYGTAIVATVGICGAVVAALIGEEFTWRQAYFVGGGMGLALLLLRIGVAESGMFEALQNTEARRGHLSDLFRTPATALKYLCCILIGVPIWYVVGVLITFSPELGKELGMAIPPAPGRAVMFCYIGLAIGDLLSGVLSQLLRSRRKIVFAFILLTGILIFVYGRSNGIVLPWFYTLCLALGITAGYWAVFVTVASEQFGTNIRATATTTVPNFVRGAVVPLTILFQATKGSMGAINSAMMVGFGAVVIALLALANLQETYGKDLDYIEGIS